MTGFDKLPRSAKEIQAAGKQFDLTSFASDFEELRILKQEMDLTKKRYELFRDRLKVRIADADELYINGRLVATHAINGAFNVSKLSKEQPHLYEPYLVKREMEVFDEEAFAKDHPHLHAGDMFRARSLRFK